MLRKDITTSNEYITARKFIIEKLKKLNKDKLLKLQKYVQDNKDTIGLI